MPLNFKCYKVISKAFFHVIFHFIPFCFLFCFYLFFTYAHYFVKVTHHINMYYMHSNRGKLYFSWSYAQKKKKKIRKRNACSEKWWEWVNVLMRSIWTSVNHFLNFEWKHFTKWFSIFFINSFSIHWLLFGWNMELVTRRKGRAKAKTTQKTTVKTSFFSVCNQDNIKYTKRKKK